MTPLSYAGFLSKPWASILLGRKKKRIKQGDSVPVITANWMDIPIRPIESYLDICGFSQSKEAPWPITFPQVLLTPLHMQIVALPAFPFPALGLVHVRQQCHQHHPIIRPSSLRAKSWVDDLIFRRKGAEITIYSELYEGDLLLWSASTTVFSRHPKGHGQTENRHEIPSPTNEAQHETWHLQANLGRQYTKVSGDFNPIHLYAWSAKIFGFERAIIHGMWTIAHVISKMEPCPANLSVQFIRPVMLPSEPEFIHDIYEGNQRFWINNTKQKVCLWGMLSV